MLEIALVCLLIALIAGGLGFTGVAAAAATIAKIIFGIFLFIALALFVLLWLGIRLIA